LAVLAAVTEVIKENDGKETETEYFAALVRVNLFFFYFYELSAIRNNCFEIITKR
jgi:hypothetical protein